MSYKNNDLAREEVRDIVIQNLISSLRDLKLKHQ